MASNTQSTAQTILIVEDDEDMVTLLQFFLEREGYQVVLAKDGRQAQQLIDTLSPPEVGALGRHVALP